MTKLNDFEAVWHNLSTIYSSVRTSLGAMIQDKALILAGLATSGFIQVLMHNSDIAINFFESTFATFGVMTILGVVKHYKESQSDWREFLFKTLIQVGIMLGVTLLGISASVFLLAVSKMAGVFIGKPPLSIDSCMYFFYSAFAIIFTYHFIKSVDLVDQISPRLLPRWFSATFRKFRKTGNFTDLLAPPNPSEPKEDDTEP